MFTYQNGQFTLYSIPKVLPTFTPKKTAAQEKKNQESHPVLSAATGRSFTKIQSLNSNLMSFRPQHKSVSLTTQFFLKSNGNGNFDDLTGR